MTTERPLWCYKKVEIPELETIQKELLELLLIKHPGFDTEVDARINYSSVQKPDIIPICPTYAEYIKSLGLFDRWEFSLFSMIVGTNVELSKKTIHVDTENWEYRCYGLNIPIINCEDTYTCFYEGTLQENYFDAKNPRLRSSKFLRTDLPYREIDRLEACNAAWVNVTMPHVPLNMHGRPRAVISTRFTPEVHDYFI